MIERDSVIPPWQQVADALRARIESGDLAPGARVPSVLDLAGQYGVAAGTARKALAALQRDGLVVSRAGWGTFVTRD